MARELVVPELSFPDDTEYPNFMTIDGQVFVMQRVECNVKQATDAVKGFYAQQFDRYKSRYEEACHELVKDSNAVQVDHLRRATESHSVTVPPAMFNKMITVINGRVCEARVVIWEPNTILTSYRMAQDYIGSSTVPVQWQDTLIANPSRNYLITFVPPVKFSCTIAYDAQGGNLKMVNQMTFHTMSYMSQCTGNATAKQVWDMGDVAFKKYFNNVNLFSPARTEVSGYDIVSGNIRILKIKDVLLNSNVIRIEEEASGWRT
jgi:hypothetical protein